MYMRAQAYTHIHIYHRIFNICEFSITQCAAFSKISYPYKL
jgi:hypothetical protein